MGQVFEPSTQRPQVGWTREGVPPAGPLYLHRDDALNVESWGTIAGANLAIRGRLLLPDGTMTQITFNHTPTTDRTRGSTDHQLTEGWLLSLMAIESGNVARYGQLYARCNLVRGPGASALLMQTLCEGYVANFNPLWWPGSPRRPMTDKPGLFRVLVGTNPAAGSDWSETVPTNALWRIISIRAQLVASAAAANRTPILRIDDGANQLFVTTATAALTAGLTGGYVYAAGGPTAVAVGNFHNSHLPIDLILPAGCRIFVATTNLQAGDDWGSPIMLIEEWIEE